MARDSVTVSEILRCNMPYEARSLGYNNWFNMQQWTNHGYNVCLEEIQTKFTQNPALLGILKSTGNKTIVEASTDKLWGTGIGLQDTRYKIIKS